MIEEELIYPKIDTNNFVFTIKINILKSNLKLR